MGIFQTGSRARHSLNGFGNAGVVQVLLLLYRVQVVVESPPVGVLLFDRPLTLCVRISDYDYNIR